MRRVSGKEIWEEGCESPLGTLKFEAPKAQLPHPHPQGVWNPLDVEPVEPRVSQPQPVPREGSWPQLCHGGAGSLGQICPLRTSASQMYQEAGTWAVRAWNSWQAVPIEAPRVRQTWTSLSSFPVS